MRSVSYYLLILAGALWCGLAGCEDGDDQIRQILPGRWELVRAFRNERATETLTGTYFIFSEEGKMETNLPVGGDAPVPFVLTNKVIEQQSPQAIRYEIKEITDSSMVLGLELRGVNFEMFLKRALPGAVNPPDISPAPEDTLSGEQGEEEPESDQ